MSRKQTPYGKATQEALNKRSCNPWAASPEKDIKTRHSTDGTAHLRRTSPKGTGNEPPNPTGRAGRRSSAIFSFSACWEAGVPWDNSETLILVPHTGSHGGLVRGPCMTQLSPLIDLTPWRLACLFSQFGRSKDA